MMMLAAAAAAAAAAAHVVVVSARQQHADIHATSAFPGVAPAHSSHSSGAASKRMPSYKNRKQWQ